MTQSASSIIKAWLLEHQGNDDGLVYYSAQQMAQETGTTQGAASGFINRMCKADAAHAHGRSDGKTVYAIDLLSVSNLVVKAVGGAGSKKGDSRGLGRKSLAGLPLFDAGGCAQTEAYDPVNVLMECAGYIECMLKTPLSNYTTEQLLNELMRRAHHG